MTLKHSIIGVWALKSFVSEDTETKAQDKPFGEKPSGHLIFTAGGHTLTLGIGEDRKPISPENPTDQERIALFKTLFAYGGRYSVDGNKVLQHIEASWSGAWTGTTQTRFVEIIGNELFVKSAPLRNPRDGRLSVVTSTWTRVE